MSEEKLRELERRSRAVFDDSVEAVDGATRARLARMRAAALEPGRGRRAAAGAWLPAGVAAAAVATAVLWQREAGPPPQARPAFALEDLDIVAGGEDFDLLAEDADFLAWAADAAGEGVG
jgi:hypothetical protein